MAAPEFDDEGIGHRYDARNQILWLINWDGDVEVGFRLCPATLRLFGQSMVDEADMAEAMQPGLRLIAGGANDKRA